MKKAKYCKLDECFGKHLAKGYCAKHYARFKRHGDPLVRHTCETPEGSFAVGTGEPDEYGCIVWQRARDKHGYGSIMVEGKTMLAHRYAWMRVHGTIPDGLCVLHTCHRGHEGCVNIEHLKLGTQQDNMRDKAEAGSQKGEKQYGSKLKDSDIPEIRRLYHEGYRQKVIAARYGVGICAISRIITGKGWAHVE